MGQQRRFSKEFKIEDVRLMNEVGTVNQVSRDLGVGATAFPGKGNPRDEELTKVQRENARESGRAGCSRLLEG